MTLREDVFAALTAGSPPIRAYPDVLPQVGVVLPVVTYSFIGGHDDWHLQGASGMRRRLLQVDSWAGTRLSADSVIDAVTALLEASTAFTVNGVSETGAGGYEEETQRFRGSREYVLWVE